MLRCTSLGRMRYSFVSSFEALKFVALTAACEAPLPSFPIAFSIFLLTLHFPFCRFSYVRGEYKGATTFSVVVMVLNKWAVVTKSAPPAAGLRPLGRVIPAHPKLRPADYKVPYVLRSFIKDRHLSEMQHIENRGMYREELAIERSRFPRMHKSLVIQTDGSLNEREFEFAVPPVVALFQDRLAAHRQRQLALAKIGKLKRAKSWETTASGKESLNPVCNALVFPYCVPKKMLVRPRVADPLSSKSMTDSRTSADVL
jgi:hypothetical protein